MSNRPRGLQLEWWIVARRGGSRFGAVDDMYHCTQLHQCRLAATSQELRVRGVLYHVLPHGPGGGYSWFSKCHVRMLTGKTICFGRIARLTKRVGGGGGPGGGLVMFSSFHEAFWSRNHAHAGVEGALGGGGGVGSGWLRRQSSTVRR